MKHFSCGDERDPVGPRAADTNSAVYSDTKPNLTEEERLTQRVELNIVLAVKLFTGIMLEIKKSII